MVNFIIEENTYASSMLILKMTMHPHKKLQPSYNKIRTPTTELTNINFEHLRIKILNLLLVEQLILYALIFP